MFQSHVSVMLDLRRLMKSKIVPLFAEASFIFKSVVFSMDQTTWEIKTPCLYVTTAA